MSSSNQNFIIGVISALALVAGLIYTLLSIHKLRLEIRDMQSAKPNKPSAKKRLPTRPRRGAQKIAWSIEFVVDIFFFLVFLIGSITTIVNYLANEVPEFAMVAQIFVLIYSMVLIENSRRRAEHVPTNEQKYSRLAGWVGLVVSSSLFVLLGVQRLLPVFFSVSVYGATVGQLFSLVVNLAIAPLLAFSLVSAHRIIRHIANAVISQERA